LAKRTSPHGRIKLAHPSRSGIEKAAAQARAHKSGLLIARAWLMREDFAALVLDGGRYEG